MTSRSDPTNYREKQELPSTTASEHDHFLHQEYHNTEKLYNTQHCHVKQEQVPPKKIEKHF